MYLLSNAFFHLPFLLVVTDSCIFFHESRIIVRLRLLENNQ